MKITKEYKNQFWIAFIFSILVLSIFSSQTKAAYTNDVIIIFEDMDNITKTKDGTVLEKLKFDIWRLDDNFVFEDIRDKLVEFNKLTNEELDSKLGKAIEKDALVDKDRVVLKDVELGNFFIRERVSDDKEKYISPILIKITYDQNDIEIYGKELDLEEKGKVKILKLSDKGEKLEGVDFSIYQIIDGKRQEVPLVFENGEYGYNKENNINNAINLLTTNKDGLIIINDLPLGEYELEEVKPLDGYKPLKNSIKIEVVDSSLIEIELINEKINKRGKYKFLKIGDDAKKSPLKDAKFGIYKYINEEYVRYTKENGDEIVLVSNDNGEFEINDIPFGIYYLKELEAPKGYYLSKGYFEFEVTEESGIDKVLIIKNKKIPPPPLTGDRGNLIYIVAFILAAGSLFIILNRKKKNN